MAHHGIVLAKNDLKSYNWINLLKELKINTLGIHSMDVMSEDFYEDAIKAGIDIEYELHVGSELINRKLFDTKPELFSYSPFEGRSKISNFCPSSEEGMKMVCSAALEIAQKYKSTSGRYYFWGDDGKCWCHCKRCASYSNSDLQLIVVNAIARTLRQHDPYAKVAYLAYCNTLYPPQKVKPESNVFLEFAPWFFHPRCPRHSIADPSCSINRQIWNKLPALLEIFPRDTAQVLEYWLDSSIYNRDHYDNPTVKIVFSQDNLRRDIEAYSKLGIKNFTTFAVAMNKQYFAMHGDTDLHAYAETIAEFDMAVPEGVAAW